jgi:hypothetical protein
MGVHHRGDIGPRLENRRMDEALEIGLTLVIDGFALLVELDQVVALDQFRSQRARHEKPLRIVGMPHADMAIGIDHVFVGKNAVRDDDVAQQVFELAHEDSTEWEKMTKVTTITHRLARTDRRL